VEAETTQGVTRLRRVQRTPGMGPCGKGRVVTPVYVGFGSMSLRGLPDAARVVAAAVRGVGRRVVLAGGWAGLGAAESLSAALAAAPAAPVRDRAAAVAAAMPTDGATVAPGRSWRRRAVARVER